MTKQTVFKDFGEFWHFTKFLSQKQSDTLFHSLPDDEQKKLKQSFKRGGWDALFKRNHVNRILDEIQEKKGIDMIAIRCKVISGKSHYMKKSDWDYVQGLLSPFGQDHVYFAIGGLSAKDEGSNTILLVRDKWSPNNKKR